jgi:hypothetical protein
MYDIEIYEHESGATLTIFYVHGKKDDGKGNIIDCTVAYISHQSGDNKIFHNHVIEEGEFFESRLEVLLQSYKNRGYKARSEFVPHDEFCQEESWDEEESEDLKETIEELQELLGDDITPPSGYTTDNKGDWYESSQPGFDDEL